MTEDHQQRHTSVATALQEACRSSGKSMGDIAMQAGIASTREWARIVNGDVRLDGLRIAAIAAALGMDPVDLGRVLIADYWPEYLDLFDVIPFDEFKAAARRH